MSEEHENVADEIFDSSRDRGADNAAPAERQDVSQGQMKEPEGEGTRPEPAPETEVAPDDASGTSAQPAPEQVAEEKSDASQDPPSEPQDQPADRHVPLKELLSEREKRQEQARLRVEAEARVKAYQEQVHTLMQQAATPQNPVEQQPEPELPDPYDDPVAYGQALVDRATKSFEQRLSDSEQKNLDRFVYASHVRANTSYGKDKVDEALDAARQAGVSERFQFEADPFASLMDWHGRTQILQRTGGNLDAYEKTIEERVRQKVLEELKAGNGGEQPGGNPQPQSLPGSLVDASAQGTQGRQVSQQALADDLYDSDRNRTAP